MVNRVEVKICGKRYNLITEDDELYTQQVAEHAAQLLGEQRASIRSESDSAVMALLNSCDEYFRMREDCELLRRETERIRNELIDLRFELSELRRSLPEAETQE